MLRNPLFIGGRNLEAGAAPFGVALLLGAFLDCLGRYKDVLGAGAVYVAHNPQIEGRSRPAVFDVADTAIDEGEIGAPRPAGGPE